MALNPLHRVGSAGKNIVYWGNHRKRTGKGAGGNRPRPRTHHSTSGDGRAVSLPNHTNTPDVWWLCSAWGYSLQSGPGLCPVLFRNSSRWGAAAESPRRVQSCPGSPGPGQGQQPAGWPQSAGLRLPRSRNLGQEREKQTPKWETGQPRPFPSQQGLLLIAGRPTLPRSPQGGAPNHHWLLAPALPLHSGAADLVSPPQTAGPLQPTTAGMQGQPGGA